MGALGVGAIDLGADVPRSDRGAETGGRKSWGPSVCKAETCSREMRPDLAPTTRRGLLLTAALFFLTNRGRMPQSTSLVIISHLP